jgi:ubiquitin-protein ligase
MYHHKYYMNDYERVLNENFRRRSRLKKELLVYYEKQNNQPLSYTQVTPFKHAYIINISNIQNKIHILNFLLEIKKNRFLNVEMKIPSDYPFKCPSEILINGFDYKYLLNFNPIYLKILGYSDTICLCCQSLCCKNNWSVHNNITHVLKEIYTNLNNKLRIRDIKMCRYLVEKKFGHYLPIEEFL